MLSGMESRSLEYILFPEWAMTSILILYYCNGAADETVTTLGTCDGPVCSE
jgi:hypothetical protein